MSYLDEFELPSGWALATIPELVGVTGLFADGDWVETKDQDPQGEVRLTQLADIGDGAFLDKSARFLTRQSAGRLRCTYLEAGDVLIARMPDPLGRACIYAGAARPAVTAVDVCIVRPEADGVNSRWLMWAVNSPAFRGAISSLQSGSTRKRISRGNLATIPLPVPPRAEQDRIAARVDECLSELTVATAVLERARANLKRYHASVLQAACDGSLECHMRPADASARNSASGADLLRRILSARRLRWRAAHVTEQRYREPAGVPRVVPALPAGWAWATLEQLSDPVRPIAYGVLQPGEEVLDGVPLVRVGDIDNGRVATTGLKRIKAGIASRYPRTKLEGGELLVTLVGSIARAALAPPALAGANTARAVGVIALGPDVDARWVELWFRNPRTVAALNGAAHEVARKTLNLEDLRTALVALPPSHAQSRIVNEVERRLSAFEETNAAIEVSLARALSLRRSILKLAFDGCLVRQDPRDEPASALLERLSAFPPAEGACRPRRRFAASSNRNHS